VYAALEVVDRAVVYGVELAVELVVEPVFVGGTGGVGVVGLCGFRPKPRVNDRPVMPSSTRPTNVAFFFEPAPGFSRTRGPWPAPMPPPLHLSSRGTVTKPPPACSALCAA
jgi:hypothetical protein